MTSTFPLIKRFADIKHNLTSAMLIHEAEFHKKYFRTGTIFIVVGWREINNKPYLILSKGSWQGLVDYDLFMIKFQKLYDK